MGIAHIDDVEGHELERRPSSGDVVVPRRCCRRGRRRRSRRIQIPAGGWSTPAHDHGVEEELFYVLGGRGLSWHKGETFEIGEGDCILFPPRGAPHAARAGRPGRSRLRPAGLRRERALPAARRIARRQPLRRDAGRLDRTGSRSSSCARPSSAHPSCRTRAHARSTIVNVGATSSRPRLPARASTRTRRNLGKAVGSVTTGPPARRGRAANALVAVPLPLAGGGDLRRSRR